MEIKISEVRWLFQMIKDLNSVEFDDITFIDDAGKPIILTEEQRQIWKDTGLNNVHFVGLQFWDENLKYFSYDTVDRYMSKLEEDPKRSYRNDFGDNKLCDCGHPYHRHFDSYEDMKPIGCKYCHCHSWREPGTPDPRPHECPHCEGTKIAKDYTTKEPIPCRQCDKEARAKEEAEKEAYFAAQEAKRRDSNKS